MTLRLRLGVPSLRSARLVQAFEHSLARTAERADFRVVHYSLQSNHAHLVVETTNRAALGRGMKSLGTPREVRNVLRYVLLNARRHASRVVGCRIDPASSARWFDGWVKTAPAPPGPAPVARARTWLLQIGWRRHGPIDPRDVPGRAERSSRRGGPRLRHVPLRDALHETSRGAVAFDPCEPAHRLAVVEAVLGLRIGEIEPLRRPSRAGTAPAASRPAATRAEVL